MRRWVDAVLLHADPMMVKKCPGTVPPDCTIALSGVIAVQVGSLSA
jgi:hypothetical protein